MANKKRIGRPKRRKYSAKAKTRRRSRRRVGATALNLSADSPLVQYGSIAAGFFFGPQINKPIKSMIGDKLDAKILGAGEGVAGYLLAMRKGKKSMIEVVAGGALLGAGIKELLTAFGIGGIGPYGMVPVIGSNGQPYGRVPVIAGSARRLGAYTPNNVLAGYNPHGTINKVMAGVDVTSGSGLMAQRMERA